MTDETPFADPLEETALDSPILRDMLAHWRFLAGGREFPRPRELDPIDIPWALGRLTLIDVRGDWPDARFRFVLCGDRHVAYFGNDLTGLWLEDNPNPMVRAPLLSLRDIVRGPRVLRHQALILPMGEPGGRVERLIVTIDFDAPET